MHNVAQLRRLQEEFPDTLVVIGVHSAKFTTEKQTENIRQAVMREGIRHPVVNDAEFKIWHAYNIHAWPTLVLIDPEGQIVGSDAGEIQAEEYIPVLQNLIQSYEAKGLLDRGEPVAGPEGSSLVPQTLSFPAKVLVDPYGRFFIADTHHHRILEMQLDESGPSSRVVRVIGSGRRGLRNGPAHQASFNNPRGMALIENTLYVADTENHTIRAVDLSDGTVRTVAGTGEKGGSAGLHGEQPTDIPLRSPWGLAALPSASPDGEHVLLIAMAGSHQIWALVGDSRLGIFAGTGREALVDGTPAESSFNQPSDLIVALNHLIIADAEASAIRAISLVEEAKVFTIVGQGLFEFGDQDGAGEQVRLQHPTGLEFQDGLVYIADSYNHKVKTLDPISGQVETLIGSGEAGDEDGDFEDARLFQPEGLAIYGNKLYIADTNNHKIRVADLQRRTVRTLGFTGLGRIPQNIPEAKMPETRLTPVEVSPGAFTVTVSVLLPDGYYLNPEATSRVSEASGRRDKEERSTISISDEGLATFETEAFEDRDLPLDLTVYYCQGSEQQLCLIDDQRLVLPLRVVPGAPDAVKLEHQLPPFETAD